MYERAYGYKYQEADSGHAPDIAKMIRQDIKQAVQEGLLPGAPVKYSVTSDTYSMGQSIDVTVKGWDVAWIECDGTVPGTQKTWPDGGMTATACPNVWCAANNDSPHANKHLVLTEEAQAAKMTLERIHGAYNHDGSEIQVDYFDVRYYGHVEFEDAQRAAWRAEEKARLAARKAAREAGTVIGKVVNFKRGGGKVVHLLVENAEGKKVLACGARGGHYFGCGADSTVNCARCAKKEAK